MSHYYALAIIPADGDVEELLAETMAPYDENREIEQYESGGETYWRNPVGLWDWYQVGGRWTGVLSNYKPEDDPANVEQCFLCHGTGKRNDSLGRQARAANPGYTCNGCDGEGDSVKWPTQWRKHGGDVLPATDISARLADLSDDQMPYAIFAHGSELVALKERWDETAHNSYSECADPHACTNKRHMGAHVTKLDNAGMRKTLATILAARMQAGLTDRVVVVDCHC